MTDQRPKLFVSSTVYGVEELLDRVYALLTTFGYEVWMSHKGTMPVRSDRTAFENCLAGVEACDLFLGLITPSYGSGQEAGRPSITHQEVRRAIELQKPRWVLAHSEVVFARRLLNDLGYKGPDGRATLQLKPGARSITDLRVLDLYEEAIRSELPLSDRRGNWVQEYSSDPDALVFASAQFARFQEVEAFIREHLQNPKEVIDVVKQVAGGGA